VVKRLLLLLLLLESGLVGAAGVVIEWHSLNGEWGKPLRGFLVYPGESDPGFPDLSSWQDDFFVELDYQDSVEAPDGSSVTRQKFRLYARAPGAFQLAPIVWGGLQSEPQKVMIKAATADGANIAVTLSRPKLTARVGEQLSIRIKLSTTDLRVKSLIELPEVAGVEFQLLQQLQDIDENDGKQLAEHQLGWALIAKKAGHYKIELPPVLYSLHGRNIRRFYLPKISLNVRPLPAYIPSHIPVGALTVNSDYDSLQNDSTSDSIWEVVVTSDARLSYGMPVFRAELAAISGVEVDQVVERVELERRLEKVITRLHYRVPLPELLLGTRREVRLNYYDLEKHRVNTLVHRLPAAWKIPQWLSALAGLLVTSILLYLFYIGRRIWTAYLRKRTLQRQIMSCETPYQLRQILLISTGHRSLDDWAEYSVPTIKWIAAQRLVKGLNEACFLRGVTEKRLQRLKSEVVEIVGWISHTPVKFSGALK